MHQWHRPCAQLWAETPEPVSLSEAKVLPTLGVSAPLVLPAHQQLHRVKELFLHRIVCEVQVCDAGVVLKRAQQGLSANVCYGVVRQIERAEMDSMLQYRVPLQGLGKKARRVITRLIIHDPQLSKARVEIEGHRDARAARGAEQVARYVQGVD